MIISDEKKFIFFHIRRTGGTSIDYALRNYYDHFEILKEKLPSSLLKDQNKVGGLQEYRILSNNYNGHLDCMSYENLVDIGTNYKRLTKQYFCFSFIRNPYDRVFSEYRVNVESKIIKNQPFEQLCTWSKPMFSYLPPMDVLDFIGRTENLNEHFEIICKKLEIKAEIINLYVRSEAQYLEVDAPAFAENINEYFHNGFKRYFHFEMPKSYRYLNQYSSESIKRVNEHYKKDFELFGYPMLNPETFMDHTDDVLNLQPIQK